ncbi:MAG: DNA polymerase III subunit beta [Alphaproteobacteria bacterium MarineAlpha6_Bin6]|nr:DNA polymerase III subunit beta [Pelagibacteraceae bacterium]PPR32010.1 MAG: DNA polymerase III subunit beta [Alphaproteobacteria bacterium MarineAlpha6_Bin6]PPR33639.1 MAG: DNA polymerase III subunit beta [Alphaproteobacteria bacterium MarineAlpha6_Bin5]|tara:strand:- start:30160 stop:31287 length:1128 start_codon:yes stop_codon:yes gene_type:complete
MKLQLSKSNFVKSLSFVQNIVESKTTIPILANVLLEAKQGRLNISATDMDITIFDKIKVNNIETDGATSVPAHTLYNVIKELPEDNPIDLSYDDSNKKLHLMSSKSKFVFSCLSKDEFPISSTESFKISFDLKADILKEIIDKTYFATSNEETRYYLNGLYLHSAISNNKNYLRAVATDGHRLAQYQINMPAVSAKDNFGVIIPKKLIFELRKLIDDLKDNIKIDLSDRKIRFSFNETVIVSKLIDGKFPDYEKVIPKNTSNTFSIDRKKFLESINRISTISSEKSKAIKLNLNNDKLTISASNLEEGGSGVEEINIKYSGPSLDIGFNSVYLKEIINQFTLEEISVLFSDSTAPTIIKDGSKSESLYVLMPMRV